MERELEVNGNSVLSPGMPVIKVDLADIENSSIGEDLFELQVRDGDRIVKFMFGVGFNANRKVFASVQTGRGETCVKKTVQAGAWRDDPKVFDPADPGLVGRRCRWSVWGKQYSGEITKVISEPSMLYERGDWIVDVDGSDRSAMVVGCKRKLLPEGGGK